MAKVLVSFELIAKTLFPDSYVRVLGVESWDTLNMMTAAIEIEGPDVPNCDWVEVTITKEMITLRFNEMDEPLGKCLHRIIEK